MLVSSPFFKTLKINRLWLFAWAFLYFCILIFGLLIPSSILLSILKLTGIALCLAFVVCYFPNDRFLQFAFVCTLVADVILSLNNLSPFGVFAFCFAQFAHFYRLSNRSKWVRVLLGIASVIILIVCFLAPEQGIIALGIIYALILVSNLIFAARWFFAKKTPAARAAFFGFILFICCDLCVLASFSTTIGILALSVKPIFDYLAWVFYYPSQVLISHSSKTVI